MTETLALRTARALVSGYAQEGATPRTSDATEPRDCEDLLQLAIDSFEWLMRADTSMRRAVFRREISFDPAYEGVVTTLLDAWVKPCAAAEKWAIDLVTQGHEVANLDAFRRCCREVAGMRTDDDEYFSHDALVRLRDEALDEHAQGKTIEYRPG